LGVVATGGSAEPFVMTEKGGIGLFGGVTQGETAVDGDEMRDQVPELGWSLQLQRSNTNKGEGRGSERESASA